MASTTSGPSNGFSPLAVVGYVVLAISFSYISLRVYSYLKLKSQAQKSLPKPVSGSSHKSAFNLGRSSGWDWRRWTLPRVPAWPKVPNVMGKAKLVASSKNLTVELLPTTGLPPPPTSIPTPMSVSMDTPQLVDLSTPATPPLTTASTSGSFQTSPRTPSPPFMHHMHASKPLYPTTTYASYSRSPSPHAFLATSPQKGHRRSKSLGGVPIRRLSGGTSGLRHAMEMQEFSPNHVRGTSREHLLIDFTSSGSSDEDDIEGGYTKISPAASDIGILPPGKEGVDARTVGRHVPLVDLGDEDPEDLINAPRPSMKVDDDSWKLFGLSSNVPALPFTRFARSSETVSELVPHVGHFVNGKEEHRPELVLGRELVDVRRMELEIRHDDQVLVDLNGSSEAQFHKEEEKESALIDLQDYLLGEEDPSVTSQPLLSNTEEERHPVEPAKAPSIPFPKQTPILVKAAFPHPLETLVHVETVRSLIHSTPHEEEDEAVDQKSSLLFQREYMPSDHELQETQITSPALSEMTLEPSAFGPELDEPSLPVSNPPLPESAKLAPSPEIWAWDEQDGADDPWAKHISDVSSSISPSSSDSEVFVYSGLDVSVQPDKAGEEDLITLEAPLSPDTSDVFVYDPELGVLEKSPGATLFATELADEEEGEMPALDLGEILPQSNVDSKISETNLLDEEEDLTPKPTPGSVELMLPTLVAESADENLIRGTLSQVDLELDSTDYADPELLPLPDSPLLLTVEVFPDPETPSLMFEKDEHQAKSTPSQTPTPPASPPPISPLRFLGASNGLQKPPSPLSDSSQGAMSSFSLAPSPGLTLVVGRSPKNSTSRDLEDKENMTPTALNMTALKPIWETKHNNALLSAPPISSQLSKSPQLRRRILVDVAAEEDREEVTVDNNESKNETALSSPKAKIEDQASQHVHALELSSSLPGAFPEPALTNLKPAAEATATTVGARLALTSDTIIPRPSARAIVRSPLDIALAMQLRPGLGPGADPAWMVRFLMAMFGWFAVVVSGQAEF